MQKDPIALANAIMIAISRLKTPRGQRKVQSQGTNKLIISKMINSYHDVWDKN